MTAVRTLVDDDLFACRLWLADEHAKTLVSAFSGHLLEHWSPENVTVEGVTMPLQQAMVEHRLDYWHRPEAMWLLLGIYALVGCIVAAFLEKWLTQGVQENRPSAG